MYCSGNNDQMIPRETTTGTSLRTNEAIFACKNKEPQ